MCVCIYIYIYVCVCVCVCVCVYIYIYTETDRQRDHPVPSFQRLFPATPTNDTPTPQRPRQSTQKIQADKHQGSEESAPTRLKKKKKKKWTRRLDRRGRQDCRHRGSLSASIDFLLVNAPGGTHVVYEPLAPTGINQAGRQAAIRTYSS